MTTTTDKTMYALLRERERLARNCRLRQQDQRLDYARLAWLENELARRRLAAGPALVAAMQAEAAELAGSLAVPF
jgi:hypothetical protein